MNTGRIVFSQLLDFLPKKQLDKCIRQYSGNHRTKTFSCFDQFLCMAFAQITFRQSLRDIETCLRVMQNKLYHCGIRGYIARANLAKANENRDWRIYADFAQVLIARARKLYANDDFGLHLKQTAYAFDSTTIDLCLTLFPWAKFRKRKAAIKLHTLMDLRGSIPCFISITDGKTHDVNILDQLPLEPGAFYIMDRGYVDFSRLYGFNQQQAFFITRAKSNMDYSRREYRIVDKTTGLRSDQTIILRGPKSSQDYPIPLRRVSYYDVEIQKKFVFITNNFTLEALTITQLYKCRWQVELFFKWIKQNLRIKTFFGTSENAVKTQIWIAICIYVLVAIIKKQLNIERSLNEILQILSITLFEKVPLYQVLTENLMQNQNIEFHKQLPLFNL